MINARDRENGPVFVQLEVIHSGEPLSDHVLAVLARISVLDHHGRIVATTAAIRGGIRGGDEEGRWPI